MPADVHGRIDAGRLCSRTADIARGCTIGERRLFDQCTASEIFSRSSADTTSPVERKSIVTLLSLPP